MCARIETYQNIILNFFSGADSLAANRKKQGEGRW